MCLIFLSFSLIVLKNWYSLHGKYTIFYALQHISNASKHWHDSYRANCNVLSTLYEHCNAPRSSFWNQQSTRGETVLPGWLFRLIGRLVRRWARIPNRRRTPESATLHLHTNWCTTDKMTPTATQDKTSSSVFSSSLQVFARTSHARRTRPPWKLFFFFNIWYYNTFITFGIENGKNIRSWNTGKSILAMIVLRRLYVWLPYK